MVGRVVVSFRGTCRLWKIAEGSFHLSFDQKRFMDGSKSRSSDRLETFVTSSARSRLFPGIRTPFRSLLPKCLSTTPRGAHFPLQVIWLPRPVPTLGRGVRIPCIGSFSMGCDSVSRHFDVFVALRERVRVHRSTCCAFRTS